DVQSGRHPNCRSGITEGGRRALPGRSRPGTACLVEAGGIEPPSVSPRQQDLRTKLSLCFSRGATRGAGKTQRQRTVTLNAPACRTPERDPVNASDRKSVV